jgi:hypothetical protein
MGARRLWTDEEIELVQACYEDTPTVELAELLGMPAGRVYAKARELGLQKSRECIAEVARQRMLDPNHPGRKHQIKPGNVPANKGKKMPGWGPGRMKETQFKKGQRSGMSAAHWAPVGSTRLVGGYVYLKISDVPNVPYTVNWLPLHILFWEEKRGPLKPGHVLVFRDGNRGNIKLSNLEQVSRRELMRRNTIHNLPGPLVNVIMLNGALKRKLRRLDRAKEQDV